ERLPQNGEHDHDASERRHHEHDARQQRHCRHQDQDLQRERVLLPAVRVRRHRYGRNSGRRRQGRREQADTAHHRKRAQPAARAAHSPRLRLRIALNCRCGGTCAALPGACCALSCPRTDVRDGVAIGSESTCNVFTLPDATPSKSCCLPTCTSTARSFGPSATSAITSIAPGASRPNPLRRRTAHAAANTAANTSSSESVTCTSPAVGEVATGSAARGAANGSAANASGAVRQTRTPTYARRSACDPLRTVVLAFIEPITSAS